MKRKFKRREALGKIKRFQFIADKVEEVCNDWMVENTYLNNWDFKLNKRKRSRVGHVEKARGKNND